MDDGRFKVVSISAYTSNILYFFPSALQDGWYRFNETKLKLFLERKTWGEANIYCQSIGGDLATISNELMNTFLLGIIPSSLLGKHWQLQFIV